MLKHDLNIKDVQNQAAKLLSAFIHIKVCRVCSEDGWEDCEGGKEVIKEINDFCDVIGLEKIEELNNG